MQEIVSFCDLHYERSEQRVPGTGFKLGIAGDWKRVDLCPACVAEVLAPLEQTILNHAVAVTEIPIEGKPRYTAQQLERKVAAMGSPRPCLWCPTTVQGIRELTLHLDSAHSMTVSEAYGDVCPICQVKQAKLSAHLGRGHMLTLATAFAWAVYSDVPAAKGIAEEARNRVIKAQEAAPLDAETFEQAQGRYEDWMVRHGKA